MDLSRLPVFHRAAIPEAFRDEMGHMNVMWYAHLFDRATFTFFKSFGCDEVYFRARKAGVFALAAHYRYLAEVLIGQRVTVRTRALGRSAKRMHFIHFLTLDELGDRLACTCELLGTHIDMASRRSSPLPAHLGEGFDRIAAEHGQLTWEPPLCGAIRP